MEQRVNVHQKGQQAMAALYETGKYLAKSSIESKLLKLIYFRVSQINGCAFCLDMHSKDARKLGMTEQRIYLLNAWKETKLYTEEEKAVLAMTEEITLIQNHLSDATYNKAIQLFDEAYVANIIMMITTINAWNRIAIATELQPAN